MRKTFIFLLLSVGIFLATEPVLAYKTNENIVYFEKTNDFESFVIYNEEDIKSGKGSMQFNEKTSWLNEYYIDPVEYQNSEAVYVQKENVYYEEQVFIAPEGYGFNEEGTLDLYSNDEYSRDSYLQTKGYITFTVKAYQIGFYDDGLVYRIEVDVTFEKTKEMIVKNYDHLIIQHGDNASTYSGIKPEGEMVKDVYYVGSDGSRDLWTRTEALSPVHSIGSWGGIDYEFLTLEKFSRIEGGTLKEKNNRVTGNYYMIASGVTEILPTYIHNRRYFDTSISVSFGPIGIGIDTGMSIDQMAGRSMTLPGYAGRINRETLKLSPEELLFEPQYFSNEKKQNHNKDEIKFKTNRLRTGYIEEEYINLSPYRSGAGTAYLEFVFEKPIHELTVDLAFWSKNEKYTQNDFCVIQYKNSNGYWVSLLDVLDSDNNVPTNRNQPKTFYLDIVYGTREIRFYSEMQNPTGNRNLGRLSIGNMQFVGYSI